MYNYSPPVEKLIDELKKLPGIGRKSAQRICFSILRKGVKSATELADAIIKVTSETSFCSICNQISVQEPCEICADDGRDRGKICVVEEPFNIYAIENTGLYNGRYHVLHGNLSPVRGIGPDELKIDGLVTRVGNGGVEEVILATSPTTEGNATAHYIAEVLKSFNIKITRVALGLPVGADLDYVDSVTIARSIEGRVDV